MALSNKTINGLANALAPEVINYILEDEKWVEFLSDIIPAALNEKLGKLEIELEAELVMAIADLIVMKPFHIGDN